MRRNGIRRFHALMGIYFVGIGVAIVAAIFYLAWQGTFELLFLLPLPVFAGVIGIAHFRSMPYDATWNDNDLTLLFIFRIERIPWDLIESYRYFAGAYRRGTWVMLKYRQVRNGVDSNRRAYVNLPPPSGSTCVPLSLKECITILDEYIRIKRK